MKYLLVGFKGENNASFQLVKSLTGEKLFLTNSFCGLKNDIESVCSNYDMLIMFGIDKKLKEEIRIEKCAKLEECILQTKIDVKCIAKKMDNYGIRYTVSDVPTVYFCNAAYYYALQKFQGRAIFIHILSLKGMTEQLKDNLRALFEQGEDDIF